MHRYFFHIVDSRVIADAVGTELPTLDAARVEAVRVAGEMLRDHAREFWRSAEWRVVVTGEDRVVLFTVSCQALAAPVPAKLYDPVSESEGLTRVSDL